MGIQIRNYRENDLPLIAVLYNAVEAFDHAQEGTTVEELRLEQTRPGFDPEYNAFVAEDEDGRIVAYAKLRLMHEQDAEYFHAWFNVHPVQRGRGLEDRLLARVLERANERMDEVDPSRAVRFGSGANQVYKERVAALQRNGMSEVRRFWTMVRPSLGGLPDPRFAPDLNVRSFRIGADEEQVRIAVNAAFRDHWNHVEETSEEWRHFLSSPYFRPELTVLAEDPQNKQVAGVCLIIVNEDENARLGVKRGLIDILCVRREYRRRGLGEALILQGMHNLRDAGMEQAFLGCDSQNLTGATRLYFRVGFEVAKEIIAFSKNLRSAKQASLESQLEMV